MSIASQRCVWAEAVDPTGQIPVRFLVTCTSATTTPFPPPPPTPFASIDPTSASHSSLLHSPGGSGPLPTHAQPFEAATAYYVI
jgi:hypothetical protein